MEVKKFNRCGQSAGKILDKIKKPMGYYLSGFADGEGSFNLSIIKRNDYRNKWKVMLSFNISQNDDTLPRLFQNNLKCGKIRYRKDGVCYFEVRSITELKKIIYPFFRKFPILSKQKSKVFEIFSQMIFIIYSKQHLEKEGMIKLIELREKIIVKRKRKYSKKEILKSY